jgi:hypothetical protein
MHFSKSALIGGFSITYFTQLSLCSPAQLFSHRDISISEAPSTQQFSLTANPKPNVLNSPIRQRFHHSPNHHHNGKGSETVNTIFSGVYPVLNLTWLGSKSQDFVAFIDTGSSDTWIISNEFQCLDPETKAVLPQSACAFGPLYNPTEGSFTNITSEEFAISYFPEAEALNGSIGFAPLSFGGLRVPKQEVALVDSVIWEGDGTSSGLVGLAYPSKTSASYRSNGSQAVYDPIFTTMVKEGIVKDAVFTLALDRVPQNTPPSAPAGTMALGGLVSPSYYYPPFTSVPIEKLNISSDSTDFSWYITTHELVYGLKNGTIASGGTYQSIVDSGTAPNFVPSAAAEEINAQFSPPGTYNETLGYWTVDCDAKAPFAAYKIGGKVMPMDPRDMIVQSLNGLPGYEDVCFSAFADGGDPSDSVMIIGEVWQRSYVVAYDIGRSMLHFANRTPY